AAGAMVVRDVAPYSVVGGNPCKFIRWRFDEDIRQLLLQAAWWGLACRRGQVRCTNVVQLGYGHVYRLYPRAPGSASAPGRVSSGLMRLLPASLLQKCHVGLHFISSLMARMIWQNKALA
ncbi:acetyltransferase, partial [Pseudomonas syringae pv. pisi str. 1704B]